MLSKYHQNNYKYVFLLNLFQQIIIHTILYKLD
jgi:hypothetical protein